MDYEPDREKGKVPHDERDYQRDGNSSYTGVMTAFDRWWDELQAQDPYDRPPAHELYDRANELLTGIDEVSYTHGNTILASQTEETDAPLTGIFLSAVYNNAKEDEIVYDVDLGDRTVKHLGYELAEDNDLILQEPAEDIGHTALGTIHVRTDLEEDGDFASFCYAHVVNESETDWLAPGSIGTVVNDEEADFMFPGGGGIAVNREHADKICNNHNGLVINTGTVNEPLSYLQNPQHPRAPHLEPTGITIDYTDTEIAENAMGIVVDVDEEGNTVLYNQQERLTEEDEPDHTVWSFLEGLEDAVSGPAEDVPASVEQFAEEEGLRFTEQEIEKNLTDDIHSLARYRIGDRIEQLLADDIPIDRVSES
jgi:hypothetical protein